MIPANFLKNLIIPEGASLTRANTVVRQRIFVLTVTCFMVPNFIWHSTNFYRQGNFLDARIDGSLALIEIGILVLLLRYPGLTTPLTRFNLFVMYFTLAILMYSGRGWLVAFWPMVFPILTIFLFGRREGLLWAILLLLPLLYPISHPALYNMPQLEGVWIDWVTAYLLILSLSAGYSWLNELAARELLNQDNAMRQAERMNTIGLLTSGISHDFNNLLMVVKGNLELLEDEIQDNIKAMALLQPVQRALSSADELTNRLLDLASRRSTEPVRLNVPQVLAELSALLQRSIGSQITLDVHCEQDTGFVLADRSGLESALLNMVVNARDASEPAGIVRLSARTATKSINGNNAHDWVCFEVTDNGEGISTERQQHIFQPFYSTKSPGQGTGLGLSMVMAFAEQHGGTAECESVPEEGTRMKLWLPVSKAQVVAVSSHTNLANSNSATDDQQSRANDANKDV